MEIDKLFRWDLAGLNISLVLDSNATYNNGNSIISITSPNWSHLIRKKSQRKT